MNEIFICYSRKDQDQVDQFTKALEKAGKDVWLDVADLHASSDWRSEIRNAITESVAFVYLLSPNSINSKYCQREFEHARQVNKKIFPILLPSLTDKDIPETISVFQWIHWHDLGSDLSNLQKLTQDIDTNYGWLKYHADLQVKATRWEENKDNSRLLRGKELRDSEDELAKVSPQDQQPTELQKQFVLESRRRETRTRNSGLTIAIFVIMALFFLSVFAFNQRNLANNNASTAIANENRRATAQVDAENQKGTAVANEQARATAQANAEEQALLAHARELSNIAVNQLDQKLDLAILLSIEAYKTRKTPQTQNALYLSWSFNPPLSRFLKDNSSSEAPDDIFQLSSKAVTSLRWSQDGKLAIGALDGSITIWDLTNINSPSYAQPILTIPGSQNIIANVISSLAWSSDGRLAAGGLDGTIAIWDIRDIHSSNYGKLLQKLEWDGQIISLDWSPDGRLASGGENGIAIWDLIAGKPSPILDYSDLVYSIVWSKDGQLASGARDGTIIIWNTKDTTSPDYGRRTRMLKGNQILINSLDWSKNELLASGASDSNNPVVIWDVKQAKVVQTLKENTYSVERVAWSEDNILATGASNGKVIIYDLVDPKSTTYGKPIQILNGHTSQIGGLGWSNDGYLASGALDSSLVLWDVQKSKNFHIFKDQNAQFNSIAWINDSLLATGTNIGDIFLWNVTQQKPDSVLKGHKTPVRNLALSSNGLLASEASGTIIVWDKNLSEPARIINGQPTIVKNIDLGSDKIAWSSSGQLAVGGLDGSIVVWDVEADKTITVFKNSSLITSLAWYKDGSLASGDVNAVKIWKIGSQQPILTLLGHTSQISSIAWGPKGQLASASSDGTIIIWDMSTGQIAQSIKGHNSWVNSIAWSNTGQLASGTTDGTATVWDVTSGQPVQTLQNLGDAVIAVAWSDDDQLAVGLNKEILLWETHPDIWLIQACQRAGRNLTLKEWNQYLDWKGSYQRTCENYSFPVDVISSMIDEAEKLAKDGKITETIRKLEDVQEIAPKTDISPAAWNSLCWWGSLWDHAAEVLYACDEALKTNPNNWGIRDSRGLARALTGDFEGAISDFQFFVKLELAINGDPKLIQERQKWIQELKAGRSPFTPEVIEALKNE